VVLSDRPECQVFGERMKEAEKGSRIVRILNQSCGETLIAIQHTAKSRPTMNSAIGLTANR